MPLPTLQSTAQVVGTFCGVRHNGMLIVEVESLTFNALPLPPRATVQVLLLLHLCRRKGSVTLTCLLRKCFHLSSSQLKSLIFIQQYHYIQSSACHAHFLPGRCACYSHGCPVYRLLRNFSLDRGLVKNARVLVTAVDDRLITVRILRPSTSGELIPNGDEELLIPRITFTHELQSGYTLLRRQFPLAPAYATTFKAAKALVSTASGSTSHDLCFLTGNCTPPCLLSAIALMPV